MMTYFSRTFLNKTRELMVPLHILATCVAIACTHLKNHFLHLRTFFPLPRPFPPPGLGRLYLAKGGLHLASGGLHMP
jgi:hypothetical protein